MRLHLWLRPLKWVVSLGLLGGLLYGLFLVHEKMQADRARERGEEKSDAPARSKSSFVHLEEDEAERYGLETERARAVQWSEHIVVEGRVVPNPRATAEVRSPFAGTLRAASGTPWPALGQSVRKGQTLGWIDVRVGPEVRLDLQNKLTEARIRQRGAEEEVKLQQSRVDSLHAVTSQQIISRVELDAALIQLAQARNQLATAKAAAELWQKAVQEVEGHQGRDDSSWSQPLLAPADGEVTDLAGRPGMSVEAGALIGDIVDFRRPLIRLDIPPEVLASWGPPPQAALQVSPPPSLAGILDPPRAPRTPPTVEGHLAGPAPRVDTASQFISYWYEVQQSAVSDNASGPPGKEDHVTGVLWRPGRHVTAMIHAPGAAPHSAVAVPAGAVLYHEGRPLVYVRIGPEKYQRRVVRLLDREGDRWFLAVRQGTLPIGVAPEEEVVVRQAQVLLAMEFLVGEADND
jgi:biotin carboxyl carrier protein